MYIYEGPTLWWIENATNEDSTKERNSTLTGLLSWTSVSDDSDQITLALGKLPTPTPQPKGRQWSSWNPCRLAIISLNTRVAAPEADAGFVAHFAGCTYSLALFARRATVGPASISAEWTRACVAGSSYPGLGFGRKRRGTLMQDDFTLHAEPLL